MSTENLRRHRRILYTGPVRLSWQGAAGPCYATAKCMDVSASGMRFECSEPIPVRSMVSLRAERLNVSGSATVRHLARRGAKYRVGLELTEAVPEKVLTEAERLAEPPSS